MARKSQADRIQDVLRLNPTLRRDDPRISELISTEAMLRKAQRAAGTKPVTVPTGTGSVKRSPEWVAVENLQTSVRRMRNDLGIDRLNVKRNEAAGLKVKRSPQADQMLAMHGADYCAGRELIPGLAGALAAFGLTADDMPEGSREAFARDLAAQADQIGAVRERFRDAGKL